MSRRFDRTRTRKHYKVSADGKKLPLTRLTNKELLQKLKEQRDFLISAIFEYENGKKHFAYLIAAILRTIFNKTKQSWPILPDLADKYGYPFELKGRNPPPKAALFCVGFTVFMGTIDRKMIQNAPNLVSKNVEEYWNEVVYADQFEHYTRREIVLIAANKLGGSHVDPVIDPKAKHLAEAIRRQSGPYSEDVIVDSVVYEMGVHVLTPLDSLIPYLDGKIADEERGKMTIDSLRTYVEKSGEVQYWNNYLRTDPTIAHAVGTWGDLSRDLKIAEFCGLHSIEEIDTVLRQAHGWGENFLRLFYQKMFGTLSNASPNQVTTVLNGSVTLLLIASHVDKFTPQILERDFGFHSTYIIEVARAAKVMM
jgi:hypothetical protein